MFYCILPRIVVYLLHGAYAWWQFAYRIDACFNGDGHPIAPSVSFIPARRPSVVCSENDDLFSILYSLDANAITGFKERELEGMVTTVGSFVESVADSPFDLFAILQVFDVA